VNVVVSPTPGLGVTTFHKENSFTCLLLSHPQPHPPSPPLHIHFTSRFQYTAYNHNYTIRIILSSMCHVFSPPVDSYACKHIGSNHCFRKKILSPGCFSPTHNHIPLLLPHTSILPHASSIPHTTTIILFK